MPDTYEVAVLTFGRGGHMEHYYPPRTNVTRSGYDSPTNWAPSNDRDYSRAVVLDNRPAVERPGGIRAVLDSPMLNAGLSAGTIDRCPEPSPMLRAGVSGGFDTLLAYQEHHRQSDRAAEPGPLDSVGVADFVAYWRARGSRVGRIEGGTIVWEGGAE